MATTKHAPAARSDVAINADGSVNDLYIPPPKGAGGVNSRGEATMLCRTEGSYTFVRNRLSSIAYVCPNGALHTVVYQGPAPE